MLAHSSFRAPTAAQPSSAMRTMLSRARGGCRAYSNLASLNRTPFFDLHERYGGKIVDYAGYAMPVLYREQSHIESHNWVRERAGLFDVSHMLQHRFSGSDAARLIEAVTPTDVAALKPFTSTLSVILNEKGGVVDDTIITKHSDNDFYVVTNAGRRQRDLAFLREETERLGLNVDHGIIDGGLIALQGPQAASALQKLTEDRLDDLYFGDTQFISLPALASGKVHVARSGYTGEDGFEISIPNPQEAEAVAEALLENESVKPIGLAARDSLRLEAGMCLYGHELTEEITPIAARLAWTIGKRRRAERDFNGADAILSELAAKSGPLRTGLVSTGPAPRQGAKVLDADGTVVGEITSGSMSPTLKQNVAMAYLPRTLTKAGTQLSIEIRGKARPATVAKLPFVPPGYRKKE